MDELKYKIIKDPHALRDAVHCPGERILEFRIYEDGSLEWIFTNTNKCNFDYGNCLTFETVCNG